MKDEQSTAKVIIGLLDESASGLDKRITDRLARAREQAVGKLAQGARTAQGRNGNGGVSALFMDYFQHHRAVSSTALAFSAVLVAFVATQQLNNKEADGQGDAFLLASELPPEAFLDKDFHAWLEETSQQ
jgi:hypothetical protein